MQLTPRLVVMLATPPLMWACNAVIGRQLARDLGLRTGAVASGNALETSARDLEFFDRHGVAAKEMEATSVAWVCWMLDLPVYALKSITDFIDHPASTAEQFDRNFSAACANLCETVVRAVDWLGGDRR